MKTWVWVVIGIIIFIVTGLVGITMFRKSKGNADSLEKARAAKAAKNAVLEEEEIETPA